MAEDDDDDWDFNPFGPSADAKKRDLLATARKPHNELSPVELFGLVEASVQLETFVPVALDLLESGRDFDLGPVKDEWQILEAHRRYFREHPQHRARFERLHRNRSRLSATDVGIYRKCGRCTDRSGELKNLYSSKEAALAAAVKRASTSLQLQPYECPHQAGWHLSKVAR